MGHYTFESGLSSPNTGTTLLQQETILRPEDVIYGGSGVFDSLHKGLSNDETELRFLFRNFTDSPKSLGVKETCGSSLNTKY